jgi:drug/metabolite transporter (DMT)-like permease
MGVLLAVAGAVAFSVMNVAIRKGVRPGDRDNGVLTTVMINVIAFCLLMVGVVIVSGPPSVSAGAIVAFAAAGLGSTFIGRSLLFNGIRHAGAARAAAVKNATPLFTLIIAVVLLDERPTLLAGVGIALVLGGIFLLARESFLRPAGGLSERTTKDPVDVALESEALAEAGMPDAAARRSMLLGLTLAGVGAVIFGASHALRKVGMDIQPDALLGALVGASAALVAHLATSAARGRWTEIRRAATSRRRMFWLAGLTGTVGQLCFFAALLFSPVSHVSVVAGSETLITVILAGVTAQGTERITRRIVLPAVLVFVGVAAIALSR